MKPDAIWKVFVKLFKNCILDYNNNNNNRVVEMNTTKTLRFLWQACRSSFMCLLWREAFLRAVTYTILMAVGLYKALRERE